MDNKRVIVALVLSFAVLFGWQYFFPAPKPASKPAAVESQAQAPAPAPTPAPKPAEPTAPVPDYAPAAGHAVTVKTPLYTAVFNTSGGVLESFTLSHYKETIQPDSPNIDMVGEGAKIKAPLGIILGGVPTWHDGQWSFAGSDLNLSDGQSQTLTFVGQSEGYRLERKLTFKADTYLIAEQVTVTNLGSAPAVSRLSFTADTKSLSAEGDSYNPTRVATHSAKEGLKEEKGKDKLTEGYQMEAPLDWGAIDSNYFIFALVPHSPEASFKARLQDGIFRLAMDQTVQLAPNTPQTFQCSYYLGPMDRALLAKAPGNLGAAVDFGWFHVLAVPLLWVLDWFYKFVHNYGIAIILLTVLIKLIFWPLSQKSYQSMEQMKKLQPMIQKLREKYGDDKQRLNQEIMHLHKTYKVNPMGGCLPMIVQIPVFFGLYKALLGAVELRHAPFITHVPFTNLIWLADLSAKDPYYVTPLIMGATMFIQQKMTPSSGDPTQAKIMMFMPVVFTFLFLNFPAGLVVYWLVNNLLSIAQQWWMIRARKTN